MFFTQQSALLETKFIDTTHTSIKLPSLFSLPPANGASENNVFKGEVHPKMEIYCYLLTLILMDRGVKCHIPQNVSGASQRNSVAAFSQTTDVDWDFLKKHILKKPQKLNIKWLQTAYPR